MGTSRFVLLGVEDFKKELLVAEKKIQFHFRAKGPMANYEDWYYLVIADDGSQSVEHEWDHVNPYKSSQANKGTKKYSLDAFRSQEPTLSEKLDKAIIEARNS